MQNYQFRDSVLCMKTQNPITVSPLQHCLPPQSQIVINMQSPPRNYEDELTEELQNLKQKNNDLIDLINEKERQRCSIDRKYNQLLIMFNSLKQQKIDEDSQKIIYNLSQQKQILIEKVSLMEGELQDAEINMRMKIKEYEDRNEESRKLLERLTENIKKKQERLQEQLSILTRQLLQRDSSLLQKQTRINELESLLTLKQDQLTRNIQQTQRDKSTFSQNLSTLQCRLQQQNAQLRNQIQKMSQQNKKILKNYSESRESLLAEKQSHKQNFEQLSLLSEENTNLHYQIQKLQFDNQELQNRIIVLKAEQQRLQSEIQLQKENIIKNQQQINRLTLELAQIKQILQNKKSQNDELTKRVNDLLEQNKLQQSQKSRLLIKIDTEIKEKNQLQLLNLSLRQTNQDIKFQNKQLQQKINAGFKVIKEKQDNIWMLQKLLADYKEEKLRIRQQNDKKWKEMKEFYEGEIQKLQQKSRLKISHRKSPTKINTFRSIYKQNSNTGANSERLSFGVSP